MGILNLTPDSFYEGSRYDEFNAVKFAEKMVDEGADMIDVGGYSSRPGAEDITIEEETRRVLKPLESIAKAFPEIPISIDTFRSVVAQRALDAGASIINDITGGDHDSAMRRLAIEHRAPYIVMHMRGTPKDMNTRTQYSDVVKEVLGELQKKVHDIASEGVPDIAVDPGFGFAKTVEQNFEILRGLGAFRIIGRPVLVGLSRKSMIWRTLEIKAEEALNGTTALNMAALINGASILRVHDVRQAKECVKLYEKIG